MNILAGEKLNSKKLRLAPASGLDRPSKPRGRVHGRQVRGQESDRVALRIGEHRAVGESDARCATLVVEIRVQQQRDARSVGRFIHVQFAEPPGGQGANDEFIAGSGQMVDPFDLRSHLIGKHGLDEGGAWINRGGLDGGNGDQASEQQGGNEFHNAMRSVSRGVRREAGREWWPASWFARVFRRGPISETSR
jgi:hypothetical protein